MLFSDVKDTKFESNSQLIVWNHYFTICCFRTSKIQNLKAIHNCKRDLYFKWWVVFGRQRYKIWKQFTTVFVRTNRMQPLFSDVKDTKFESNSQLISRKRVQSLCCFRTSKIQNLKAIHNQIRNCVVKRRVVFGRQRYKIWKQFTTDSHNLIFRFGCFRTSKIQNLKAIHNYSQHCSN